jgi:putative phosphoesterase
MRILIISDIHGNLPALEYVLKHEKDADMVISLGDVVNYGPWSNECVDILDALDNKILISGNHEEAFLSGAYPGTHPVAKAFFDFCYPSFTRHIKIKAYLHEYSYMDFDFVHTLNNSYIFPDTEIDLHNNIFIGHSHRPFLRTINTYKLINVGSVGQNRTNANELNYAIWQTETKSIDVITRQFSANGLLNAMRAKGYPTICTNYIESKLVPN